MKKAPYESGDLVKDHAAAKEDLNRSAVHVSDSIRKLFERLGGKGLEAKEVAAMRDLQESLEDVYARVNEVASTDSKKASSKKDAE